MCALLEVCEEIETTEIIPTKALRNLVRNQSWSEDHIQLSQITRTFVR